MDKKLDKSLFDKAWDMLCGAEAKGTAPVYFLGEMPQGEIVPVMLMVEKIFKAQLLLEQKEKQKNNG